MLIIRQNFKPNFRNFSKILVFFDLPKTYLQISNFLLKNLYSYFLYSLLADQYLRSPSSFFSNIKRLSRISFSLEFLKSANSNFSKKLAISSGNKKTPDTINASRSDGNSPPEANLLVFRLLDAKPFFTKIFFIIRCLYSFFIE